MSTDRAQLAERFQAERPHLMAVGYRLTGSVVDAEDAVQEAWLRLERSDVESIADLRGWLTTVVGRIGLDRLRSAAVRRERYVGSWLPEPVVEPLGGDPLEQVVHSDGARLAVMVVLDRLAPPQRVAFVLHDAFDVPFADIAATLGCSVAAARQHATRARRAVAAADVPPSPVTAEQLQVLGQLVQALSEADLPTIVRLLHPDVVLVGDGGGQARTAIRPVAGRDKVARFLVGLVQRYGQAAMAASVAVLVNGEVGIAFPDVPATDGGRETTARVATFTLRDGLVEAMYDISNPAKLGSLRRLATEAPDSQGP